MAITLDGTNGITSPDFEPSSSTTPTNGLFLPATNALGFATNSTERLRLDASGNLGLGVTPSGWGSGFKALQIGGGVIASIWTTASGAVQLGSNVYTNTSGNDTYTVSDYASKYYQLTGKHVWLTAPSGTAGAAISFTQAMTLDASGNLGIGTTTLTAGSTTGFNFLPGSATISYATGSNGAASLWLGNDNNGSNSSSGTNCGYIAFRARFNGIMGGGNDIASIYGTYTGDGTTRSGAIRFLTLNAGTEAERARIDSSGNLLVGKTSSSGTSGEGVTINPTLTSVNAYFSAVSPQSTSAYNLITAYSTGAANYRFYVDWGGTVHATSTSIAAISDISLKKNIRPLETGLAEVLALQPRRFDWKNGDDNNVAGFIAQEVETVLPDLISDYKYNDEETKKAIKMGDMIPTLVKAIQELTARLEALENK